MKSIILLVSIIAAYFTLAINAFPSSEAAMLKVIKDFINFSVYLNSLKLKYELRRDRLIHTI